MMGRKHKIPLATTIGIIAVLIAGFILKFIYAKPDIIVLDVSTTHFVSQVPPRRDALGITGALSRQNVFARIRFPGNRSYEGKLFLLDFRRDGELITTITMMLNNGTIDDVYIQAMQFAKDWGLPTDLLQSWYGRAKQGTWRGDYCYLLRNDIVPTVDLEVRPTGFANRPAYIFFEVAWPWTEGAMATSRKGEQK
jgi:hypothetical protein